MCTNLGREGCYQYRVVPKPVQNRIDLKMAKVEMMFVLKRFEHKDGFRSNQLDKSIKCVKSQNQLPFHTMNSDEVSHLSDPAKGGTTGPVCAFYNCKVHKTYNQARCKPVQSELMWDE